jgi:ribA/ribD-fused uncharacterized protein
MSDPAIREGKTTIDRFAGEYAFLSNFSASDLTWQGLEVATVEHGFNASKTLSATERLWVATAPTAAVAKRRGRRVTLRSDWERAKTVVMAALLVQKFTRHRHLALALIATGDAHLVEGNHWNDTFWGVCGGRGRNELGLQLMAVRTLLQRVGGHGRDAGLP